MEGNKSTMTDEIYREVFIKNIPYDIDDDNLSEWCSSFGPITKCILKRDRFGNSRGFAFVTYATIEGYRSILSQIPHYCKGRPLYVRTANGPINSSADQSNSSSDPLPQTTSINENFNPTPMENHLTDDDNDDHRDRLGSLRDELEANLECMQIAHEHEIKILREKLSREKKLRNEAEELYKDAEEDWRKVNEENLRLRTSLIKNVMQTFNIRKDFARRTKEQLKKCTQCEQQCSEVKANQLT